MTALDAFESCNVALPCEFALDVTCPVVFEGRMLPNERLSTAEGAFVETDGAEHGDDSYVIVHTTFRLGVVTFAEADSNAEEARRYRRARVRYHRRLFAALAALASPARRSASP